MMQKLKGGRVASERAGFIALLLVAIFFAFSGSTEPVASYLRGTRVERYLLAWHSGNSIVFNLAIGYIVSVFFWLLVVYMPERHRRALLRDNLQRRYRGFREGTIGILLSACCGSYNSDLPEQLCDYQKFKAFFNENQKERWYAALNGLEDRKDLLSDLVMELQLFSDEVAYVLDHVNIDDPTVHSFFKRLNEHIYRLKNASVYSYDSVKYVTNFMWEIHARWSIVEGQLESDVIEDMIEAI
jgi:hypothetical protein